MQRFHFGAALVLALSLIASGSALASGVARPAKQDPLLTRVAITQAFNVAIVNGNGGARRVVTSRGTGYSGVWYPAYAWSYDGKYLLLVKSTAVKDKPTRQDLLLLDANGAVLRTLAQLPESSDFQPQWAQDADQIAYVAWQKWPANSNKPYNQVNVVDVLGKKSALWGYWSTGEGCGGGTGDPADRVFWAESGFGDIALSLVWNVSRHIAVFAPSCTGGLALTNLRSKTTRLLGVSRQEWNEAALSRNGILAAAVRTCNRQITSCTNYVTLVNTNSGQLIRNAGPGELPTWSPDGHTLYFSRRDVVRHVQYRDEFGNKLTLPVYSSSIWRTNADGTHGLKLLSEDAYGFGPLQITPDGASLIYARVDNDTIIGSHLLANGRFTQRTLQQYGPRPTIERFDSGHRPIVMTLNAGRPSVRP